MRRDNWGLIVQLDGDGGDTCQRTGMYWFGRYLAEGKALESTARMFMSDATKLEQPVGSGLLVRHPFQRDFRPPSRSPDLPVETYRSDPNELSRDNFDALVIALGALEPKPKDPLGNEINKKPFLDRVFRAHRGRFYFYQNKDLAQLQTFSMYDRAYERGYMWLRTCACDIGLLFSSLSIVVSTINKPDDSDDINHFVRLCQAVDRQSTPVSWLARILYAWFRPKTYGSYVGEHRDRDGKIYKYPGESNNVMGMLMWYFRPGNYGNIEIAEVYRPFVAQYFSRPAWLRKVLG